MNAVFIVFLVIIIIVAIYLASSVLSLDYLIQNSKPLNPSGTIVASALDGPSSSRYFYEGWIYINTNVPVNQENVLFRRGKEFIVTLKGSTLSVWAPTASFNGSADDGFLNPDAAATDSSKNKLVSIPNFPYQKWAQLVINVDGNQVDIYIDGQFVQSLQSSSPIGSTATNDITYGNKYVDGKIARFRRPSKNINPQGVWQSYQKGSGQSESVSDYHLNVGITKNKQVRYDARLY